MLYELRTYYACTGKMPELQARFRDHTCALFERHGITPVAFWVNEIGGRNDELTYLLAFPDHASRAASWEAFRADPDWIAVHRASEQAGPLVRYATNRTIRFTDFSPFPPPAEGTP